MVTFTPSRGVPADWSYTVPVTFPSTAGRLSPFPKQADKRMSDAAATGPRHLKILPAPKVRSSRDGDLLSMSSPGIIFIEQQLSPARGAGIE